GRAQGEAQGGALAGQERRAAHGLRQHELLEAPRLVEIQGSENRRAERGQEQDQAEQGAETGRTGGGVMHQRIARGQMEKEIRRDETAAQKILEAERQHGLHAADPSSNSATHRSNLSKSPSLPGISEAGRTRSRPACRKARRSANSHRSPSRCVVIRMVLPAAFSRLRMSMRRMREAGSRLAVGSSSTSMGALKATASRAFTFCFMPPESVFHF